MDFKGELSGYQDRINTELNLFFSRKLRQVSCLDPSAKDMVSKCREFNLRGGKRIRPILVIMGYGLLKSTRSKLDQLTKAALAVELMESFLLVHDDIIDNDTLRRGKPTLHKVYEDDRQDPLYGKNMALLAGDLLAIFGSEPILSTGFNHKLKASAIAKFNNIIANTIFGQTLDYLGNFNDDFSEAYIKKIHILKTAKYTLEGPLQIGAILAGAKQHHLNTISGFSIPLGQAFQIKDDMLNLFGTESVIGKPAASDIREGKKTLLISKALERSSEKQKHFISSCLGNDNLKQSEITRLKNIITSTGSLDYSKSLAADLVDKAKLLIRKSKFRGESKVFLLDLADYIISRDK